MLYVPDVNDVRASYTALQKRISKRNHIQRHLMGQKSTAENDPPFFHFLKSEKTIPYVLPCTRFQPNAMINQESLHQFLNSVEDGRRWKEKIPKDLIHYCEAFNNLPAMRNTRMLINF